MSTLDLVSQSVLTRSVEQHEALIARDAPVMLHMPSLLTSEYCDEAASRLRKLELKPYDATVGSDQYDPIPKLGPALFEYHDDMVDDGEAGLQRYFDQADADSSLLRGQFDGSSIMHPLEVLHAVAADLLSKPVAVATEGERAYFAGVVRDINGGALPHCDDASFDTPNLAVGQTDRQLSILLYLTDFEGGGLVSYDKKPTAEDNINHVLSYGYTWKAVQGVTFRGVTPAKGSVVAFNPRYLHSVVAILGDQRRITVSTFIGRTRSTGELISWS